MLGDFKDFKYRQPNKNIDQRSQFIVMCFTLGLCHYGHIRFSRLCVLEKYFGRIQMKHNEDDKGGRTAEGGERGRSRREPPLLQHTQPVKKGGEEGQGFNFFLPEGCSKAEWSSCFHATLTFEKRSRIPFDPFMQCSCNPPPFPLPPPDYVCTHTHTHIHQNQSEYMYTQPSPTRKREVFAT